MKTDYIRPDTEYAPDGVYEFTTSVNLDKSQGYTVNIYTSGRYILEINNTYVCEGPCKSHERIRYYDSVTTDLFKKGLNEIKITVLHVADEKYFTTVYKKAKPEVVFEAVSPNGRIATDSTWKCRLNKKINLRYAKWRFLPPYEDVDFSAVYTHFPVVAQGCFDFEKGVHTFCGIANGEQPEKRPIPMIFPGEDIEFTVVKKGEDFVELDAGCYTTAKVYFEFGAGAKAKIIYAECYKGEQGKKIRDDSTGFLEGYYDTVATDSEQTRYSPFWFRTFRFIRIEAENIENALLGLSAKKWHYPITADGSFECSDDYFNKMYDISYNTMLCCTHDVFYDCPYYEQQQYEMDAAIEAAVFLKMTGDVRPVKKCIEEFAASQLPSGVLLSIYPSVFEQIIPGYSFFWIFMLKDYVDYSGDTEFAKQFIPNIDKIITYFSSTLSPDGLITKGRYWDFVDWVDEWDNGEPLTQEGEVITVYSMYFAYALLCAKEICEKCGRKALASEYEQMYNETKDNITKHCFDVKRGLYTDSDKGNGYSMHTIIWAIISELATGDDAAKLASHLDDEDLAKSSFSFNFYLFRALEKCGQIPSIFDHMDGWRHMIDNHCTSWCENPGDNARSECHGWSSAPLYEFAVNILGVKTSFDDMIVINPYTAGLSYAKGTVPTRFGNVYVSWEDGDDGFKIQISSPANTTKKLVLPNGEVKVFKDENYII